MIELFFTVAALLIQLQFAPQPFVSAKNVARVLPANSETSALAATVTALPPAPVTAGTSAQPVAERNLADLPDAPVRVSAGDSVEDASTPMPFIKSGNSITVSVDELRYENRRKLRMWRGLAIASHGAATFDAWSTRHAITAHGAQELNPMLRPFAGNASLYAVIQIGPALMDYAGRKMMYSRHAWVRRLWWVPQGASFVSSLFCGAHNLSIQ